MENNFKALSVAEYQQLSQKDSFDTEDVKRIAKFIPSSLETELNTSLTLDEKRQILTLVCRNIYKVLQVYNSIVQNDGKYDYLITKDYLKMCIAEVGNDDAKLIPLKAAYIFANGTGSQDEFEGKIPKKGLFSNRQSIANQWIDNFIKHLGWHIISLVMSKTSNNKELTFIATTQFAAVFLMNAYPNEFRNDGDVRQIITHLSKI